MQDQEYQNGIEYCLRQLLQPDTAIIRQATEQLSSVYFKDPRCIPSLNNILCNSSEWQIRQLAAVLMRKRIVRVWSRMPMEIRQQLKAVLLQRIINDDHNLVRHSIARVVSVIAKHDIPAGHWKELLEFLYTCCQSEFVGHREVGMYVLETLVETISAELRNHLPQLMMLLGKTIEDPNSMAVRISTIQLIGGLVQQLETNAEVELVKSTVPTIIRILNECLENNQEEYAIKIIDVLEETVEIEVPFLTKYLDALTDTFLRVACNTNFEDTLRVRGLLFVQWVAKYKSKVLLRSKLVGKIVDGLIHILAEPDEDVEEEDEDDETSNKPNKTASHVLDSMTINLPPDSIIPPIMANVQAYMNDPDYRRRRAVYIAILVAFEGCAEFLSSSLKNLVELILHGMQDPHPKVRDIACAAIEQCSIYMQPEISTYHQQILPQLMVRLQDESPSVREKACHAIETFCEYLGDDIVLYQNELMERLVYSLSRESTKVQQVIIIAIGSVAHAAKRSFEPYFDNVNSILQQLVTLDCRQPNSNELDDDLIELKGLSVETIGTIGLAVGREKFQPYINSYMDVVIAGIQTTNSERFRECSFAFFSSIADLLKEDFHVYLATVMKIILDAANSEEGLHAYKINDDDDGIPFEEDDEEDDDDENANYNISVTTAHLNEKETACDAIGEICKNTGVHFLPYFQDCLKILQDLVDYFHSDVRKAAVVALGKMLRSLHTSSQEYQYGQVSQEVRQLIAILIPLYLKIMSEDDVREVVTACIMEILDSLHAIGFPLLEDNIDALATMILQIFEKKAYCQSAGDDDLDGEGDENNETAELEDSELESALIDANSDLTSTIAVTLGERFMKYFPVFLKYLKKYYKKNRPPSDRSMAIGCIAEMVRGIKESVVPYVDGFLPIFLTALGDTEPEIRRNAAYGCGLLCQHANEKMLSHYQAIANSLIPIIQGDDAGAADNACSCLCRMVVAAPNALPQDQVFSAVISCLPLKEDYSENTNVLNCIISFLKLQNPILMQKFPELLKIFGQMLGYPLEQLKDDSRTELTLFLKQFSQEHRDAFQQVFATLPEADRKSVV